MVVLQIAQVLYVTQELKASTDCMLGVYRVMPPPLSTIDGICVIARSYEQLQSNSMARFWWKKLNPALGVPIRPDICLWEAMADRLFDAELYVFAADFYAQAMAADVKQQFVPSNRFRYRYLFALLAFVEPQGPTINTSAKKSSEFDEHSSMKRRFSAVKRLRVKRSSADPTSEKPSSAGVEKHSSDEEQIIARSSSTSLLDVYPLDLSRTEDFIASCGREPGFADLDLNQVGEFARLAHYRSRVLTGKHASVNNLDTTKVKPQWLQEVEKAVAFIKTHQQHNLASCKVVVEGDSIAHLSEVHTRLVLMITTLCRQYTRDFGETSFTRRLRGIIRKLIEWKFTRISEAITALRDAKAVAIQEEKQRNLEFYHVHRA
ncbi:hypothetical protein L917_13834 [Phytophthora nicotianae]|uniref:Uncharacterized protein n=1 Tax=Phytophthora nicotianae TaxID=4792 RepID=W2KNI4_PHYNI|nr:hypothetical protein L917_13834 [Phytophthora nicotianae]